LAAKTVDPSSPDSDEARQDDGREQRADAETTDDAETTTSLVRMT
jgi:hypothetical protein